MGKNDLVALKWLSENGFQQLLARDGVFEKK